MEPSEPGKNGQELHVLDHRTRKSGEVTHVDDLEMVQAVTWRQHLAAAPGTLSPIGIAAARIMGPTTICGRSSVLRRQKSLHDVAAEKLGAAADQDRHAGILGSRHSVEIAPTVLEFSAALAFAARLARNFP